jgi:5-methylcytosine-specific restriction endonuclease McrA
MKEWRAANQGHVKEYARQYYLEKGKPNNAQRYQRYRDDFIRRKKQYYYANREKCIAHHAEWKRNNTENLRLYEQRRYETKYAYMSEKNRRWRKEHPFNRAQCEAKRRARINDASVGKVDYNAIVQRDGMVCYLCDQEVSRETLSFDHVVPLARGGAHSMDNIRVCHKSCNFKKGHRAISPEGATEPAEEWIEAGVR